MTADEKLAVELDERARAAVSLAEAQRLAVDAARLRRDRRGASAGSRPTGAVFRN